MMIYLDSAATTRPYPSVTNMVGVTDTVAWGNPHSIHAIGLLAGALLGDAEVIVGKAIKAPSGGTLWTSGGTEANTLAITSVCNYTGDLVCSMGEHLSIEQYRRQYGIGVELDNIGCINIDSILKVISKYTKLVSLFLVNNETGSINEIETLAHAIKEKFPDILIHTDAVQAFGKIDIDIEKLGVDLISLSAHKIHGPKGVGCLWASYRALEKCPKLISLYRGTPSTSLIGGFAEAINRLDILEHQKLVEEQSKAFQKALEATKVLHSYNAYREAHKVYDILSIYLPEVDAIELILRLSDKNIMLSYGSACSTSKSSRVIEQIEGEKVAKSSIRVSFGEDCRLEDIETAANLVAETVKEIRDDQKVY